MDVDQMHRELALEAINDAFKARINKLYDRFDDALESAEDATDVATAEERLATGLQKALDASRRIRTIAGVAG